MIRGRDRIPGLLLLPVLLAPLLVACGKVPTTHYYVLELNPGARHNPSSGDEQGIAVGVKAFRIDPPYDQDRIVYRVREHTSEIGFYAYHRWASPLSRMLPVVVAAGLHGAEGVRAIEPVVAGRHYDAYLVGRLLVLEEIDHRDGQDVRIRLKLALRRIDGPELWSQIVSAEDTIRTDQVGAVVESMNDVLAAAVTDARPGFIEAIRMIGTVTTSTKTEPGE